MAIWARGPDPEGFLFKGFLSPERFFVRGLRVLGCPGPGFWRLRGFWAAQGPHNPEKFLLLRVKVFLLRVLGFGQNRESFLFKGFLALRKVFC